MAHYFRVVINKIMQQLVLSFSEKTLTLLLNDKMSTTVEYFPLEIDKPLVKERISATIQHALSSGHLGRITWFAPDFTLFPSALFDANQLGAYYELNHGKLPETHCLRCDTIDSCELVVIYSIPIWLDEYCKNELKFRQLKNEVSIQLAFLAQQKQSDQIQVFFHDQYFVLSVFRQKQLLTCTASSFLQESDFIYFLLAHQQKLHLHSSFQLQLTEASLGINLDQIQELLSKFKDFEDLEVGQNNLNKYQNNILCGSFEEH